MHKERRQIIKDLLESKAFVSLDEMKALFSDVSEMTLRRDIEYFESQGIAIKVRGGCRSVGFISQNGSQNCDGKPVFNLSAKRAISKAAAAYLETGRSIFIDSGTTMRTFTEFIPDKRYAFTTTDPRVALELCRSGMSTVNIVGGRLEGENLTVTGLQATRFLEDVNIDIAILTPTGFSLEDGFTVGSFNECELKRIVARKARVVIMLMDSMKCNRSLPYTFCNVEDTDVIITDASISEELRHSLTVRGGELIIAE